MSASGRYVRRKWKATGASFLRRRKGNSRRPPSLVFFLSLIILIETTLLLFLIPKKASFHERVSGQKQHARHQARSQASKATVAKTSANKQARPAVPLPPLPQKETAEKPTPIARGKIAIVLDDWGYSAEGLDVLSQIRAPLTIAILPFCDFSLPVAEFAHRHNIEAMIHMPMEPKNKERVDLEPKTLMTAMNSKTMNRILEDAFEDVPYAKGINNHMGSLATEDEAFITVLFRYLKKKNAFFLDSYVSPQSVCLRLARQSGVKFGQRAVFLDNSADRMYIQNQLLELAKRSEADGYAIGIGHNRKNTLDVLKEEVPRLEDKGYCFVFVSELVN